MGHPEKYHNWVCPDTGYGFQCLYPFNTTYLPISLSRERPIMLEYEAQGTDFVIVISQHTRNNVAGWIASIQHQLQGKQGLYYHERNVCEQDLVKEQVHCAAVANEFHVGRNQGSQSFQPGVGENASQPRALDEKREVSPRAQEVKTKASDPNTADQPGFLDFIGNGLWRRAKAINPCPDKIFCNDFGDPNHRADLSHEILNPCKDGISCQQSRDHNSSHYTSCSHPCLFGQSCNDYLSRNEKHCKYYYHEWRPICEDGSRCKLVGNLPHRQQFHHPSWPDYIRPCQRGKQCPHISQPSHLIKYCH
eukprot:TRINITY_DN12496_c0_g1_i1.p1 TRINITY_DN12496_c0_g1~~TRINITY_DN12496_c0_g1_i1.p1  ORF type:complete len:306 (+),score=46.49 TRINITY_DN12496_c0_g1_i1:188-1105(+)